MCKAGAGEAVATTTHAAEQSSRAAAAVGQSPARSVQHPWIDHAPHDVLAPLEPLCISGPSPVDAGVIARCPIWGRVLLAKGDLVRAARARRADGGAFSPTRACARRAAQRICRRAPADRRGAAPRPMREAHPVHLEEGEGLAVHTRVHTFAASTRGALRHVATCLGGALLAAQ